jgi:hypothetical protein
MVSIQNRERKSIEEEVGRIDGGRIEGGRVEEVRELNIPFSLFETSPLLA